MTDGVVARRQVRDRLDPGRPLDRGREEDRVHPRARAGVVVHVDESDSAGVLQRLRQVDEPADVPAERRVELDGDDPLLLPERAGQPRLGLLLAERDDELALLEVQARAGLALLLDGRADGGDLGRRRPAAAADDLGPELARVGRELGEVFGRRMGIDDAPAGEARQADVGQGRERLAVRAHLLQCGERGHQPRAVVRADRGHVQAGKPSRRIGRPYARERLGAFIEGHQRHDR